MLGTEPGRPGGGIRFGRRVRTLLQSQGFCVRVICMCVCMYKNPTHSQLDVETKTPLLQGSS